MSPKIASPRCHQENVFQLELGMQEHHQGHMTGSLGGHQTIGTCRFKKKKEQVMFICWLVQLWEPFSHSLVLPDTCPTTIPCWFFLLHFHLHKSLPASPVHLLYHCHLHSKSIQDSKINIPTTPPHWPDVARMLPPLTCKSHRGRKNMSFFSCSPKTYWR